MPRPALGLKVSSVIIVGLLLCYSTISSAQRLDRSVTYLSGYSGIEPKTQGQLIVGDSAVFFTKRNGEPIFALPFSAVGNCYGSPDLYAGREQHAGHYLVIVVDQHGVDQAVAFEAAPFVPDTLVQAILANLDARRTAIYSSQLSAKPFNDSLPRVPASVDFAPPTLVERGARKPSEHQPAPEIEVGAPGYKDSGTATLLSLLITGGGQFYLGETGKGAFYLVGALAAVGIGAGLSSTECGAFSCDDNLEPLYIGGGVAVLLSLISIFDAAPAAHRHNRKLAAQRAPRSSLTPVIVPSSDRVRVGLNMAVGW